MKNSLTLFSLIAFCFGLLAFRPLAWVPVTLDSRVSVLMPAQPQEAPMPAPNKALYVKDTVGVYIIAISPLGVDFQGDERKTYYDSAIEGVLEGSKGKVESRSTFKIGNYDGIDFAVRTLRPGTQQTMIVFMRSILIDKKAYVLQFIPADGSKNVEAQRKPFFESITLKPVAK
jgi:hypothetical protein